MKKTAIRKEVALLSADLLALFGCPFAALALRFGEAIPNAHLLPFLLFFPLFLPWRLAMAYGFGLYDFRHRLRLTDHVFGGSAAALLGVLGQYGWIISVQAYSFPYIQLSRLAMGLDVLVTLAWFTLSRGGVLYWMAARGEVVRLHILAPSVPGEMLAEQVRTAAPRLLKLVGCTPPESPALAQVLENTELLLVAGVDLSQEMLCTLLHDASRQGKEVFLYPGLSIETLAAGRVESLAEIPVVPLNPAGYRPGYRLSKRIFDFAAALVLLVLTLPVTGLAVLLIKLTSPGPAFYVQERQGKNGQPFRMWKLRTMRQDAESQTGPVLASEQDPRVTAVGRWLRRFRIDELPQFWNVLRGEMSLVGPRPERPEFAEQFIRENPLYALRLLVQPGLTGLAQVHAAYGTEYEQKLRYDLAYIYRSSMALDIQILLRTIRTVLTGQGAV